MVKRVTIQDIADELGLSRNTVSKALNGAEGLADATREKIIEKAMDMGYKQFAYAQVVLQHQGDSSSIHLVEGDKHEVALLTTSFLSATHFSSLMLDAFQNELTHLGLTLNSHRVSPDNLAKHSLPITLDLGKVVAIVCVEMFDRAYDEYICSLGVPVLFVDGPASLHGETLPCDQLYMENSTQIMQLVNSTLEQGMRRVGFVGDWEHCQSFFERYSAYRLAMMMAEAPVEEKFLIKQNHFEDILAAINELDDLPDLFVCSNDFVALDLIHALTVKGYEVPRDVLVSGFDDSAESRRSVPALTTVHIHTQVMAFSAIQLLRTRIKEPSLDYRQLYTETELIVRASTQGK